MATTIVTKNSSTAAAVPTAAQLVQGELAVNVADKRLFTEDNGGAIVELGVNPATEITANAGIALPDSQKATFGAGDDLQIYHDGSNSYIDNVGAGSLIIQDTDGTGDIYIKPKSGQTAISIYNDNTVEIAHSGNVKLSTTSTGIDVTGTVVADGVEVDGLLHIDGSDNSNVASFALTRTDASWSIDNETNFRIYGNTGDTTNPATKRFEIGTGGDISFYEDTGTTAKLFWDASAESLGIGTSSPATLIEASGSNTSTTTGISSPLGLTLRNTDTTDGNYTTIQNRDGNGDQNAEIKFINASHAGNTGAIAFTTRSATGEFAEKVRISPTGNVSIGTSNTSAPLRVNVGTDQNCAINTSGGNPRITAFNDAANVSIPLAFNGSILKFEVGGTERMRIDSSGNLLVGKTSSSIATAGTAIRGDNPGLINSVRNGVILELNRLSTDGDIVDFFKDGNTVGSIGSAYRGASGDSLYFVAGDTGIVASPSDDSIVPVTTNGAGRDAAINLGTSSTRFKDLYRSGSTYSTSDRNMKQDIRELTDAERNVAVACKGLLKAFRFIDAVEKDGGDANIHFGVIAQELEEAFKAEGLDANDYQVYKSATTTDEDGNEQTRLNVCYENLLAFIIAAL